MTPPTPSAESALDALLGRIADEFAERWRRGEAPDAEEYARLHPEVAELLREMLPALRAFEALPPSVRRAATPPWQEGQAEGAPDIPAALWPPVADRFEILEKLGEGGMGVVYKARQLALNRLVALKVINPVGHPGERERFRTEAEAVARLQHPNIVQIFEVGEHQGRPFLCLELVGGGSLAQQTRGEPQPPLQAARLVEVVARAVHHAHQKGIVHRDLKPANILLQRSEVRGQKSEVRSQKSEIQSSSDLCPLTSDLCPKVTDFGLAKQLDADTGQTQTGAVMGTASYMAPEQAAGQNDRVGPAADVYALGAVLYDLLTGRPPFKGVSTLETLRQVREEEAVPPARLQPGVPRDLNTICLKCLEKEPGKRYESALALAEDLRRFLAGEPIMARPVGRLERAARWARRRPAAAALLAVSVVAALASVGFAVGLAYSQRLEDALKSEGTARADAETARGQVEAALGRERQLLYLNRVMLAQTEVREGHLSRAADLLLQCPAELRHWEWHHAQRAVRREALTLTDHRGPVTTAAWAPDARLLATVSLDDDRGGVIRLWDPQTGNPVRTLSVRVAPPWKSPGHWWGESAVAFHPHEPHLAVGEQGTNLVKLWDLSADRAVREFTGHQGRVTCLAFSPDGKRLATGALDWTVRLWDVGSGQELRTVWRQKVGNPVGALRFSPDGKRLAISEFDRVRVCDPDNGAEVAVLSPGGSVGGIDFHPQGRMLAVAGPGLSLWNTQTWRQGGAWPLHPRGVNGARFSPDGQLLATAAGDNAIRVWGLSGTQLLHTFRGHTGAVNGLAFSPDGKRLASAGSDRTVKVWDVAEEAGGTFCKGHAEGILHFALSPDGERLASCARPRRNRLEDPHAEVKVWDTRTGQEVVSFAGHTGDVTQLAFSPDGGLLATVGFSIDERAVRLWDARTGKELRALKGHEHHVRSVAFHPQGELLASASWDGTVRLWDVRTGQERRVLRGHAKRVLAVAVSSEGLLASGGDDGTVRLWDLDTGKESGALPGHKGTVFDLAFSPDGKLLASAGEDYMVRVWDVATRKEQCAVRLAPGVARVAFSPDGKRLLCRDPEALLLVEPTYGQVLLTLPDPLKEVRVAYPRPDGLFLVRGTSPYRTFTISQVRLTGDGGGR